MSADLVIRQLDRDDLDSLLWLYRHHLHEHDDPLPERLQMEDIWNEILREPGQLYLGAFIADELVAACNAAVIANLTRGARPYALIENVVTHARYRRRGIGSALLRAMLDRCWARRCYKVTLTSGFARSDVHGFYESLGFDKNARQAFVITKR